MTVLVGGPLWTGGEQKITTGVVTALYCPISTQLLTFYLLKDRDKPSAGGINAVKKHINKYIQRIKVIIISKNN